MIIKISHILNISNLLHKWRERKLPIKKKKKREKKTISHRLLTVLLHPALQFLRAARIIVKIRRF